MSAILLTVILRKAKEPDMPALMQVEEDCFGSERFSPQVVRAFIERENAFIMVGMDGSEITGSAMALYSEDANEGKIASIAVLRKMRGQGIGAQLLEECENVFRAHNLKRYSLEVETNNEPAIALYTSRGFRIRGVIDDFYGQGRPAYCMEKLVERAKATKVKLS